MSLLTDLLHFGEEANRFIFKNSWIPLQPICLVFLILDTHIAFIAWALFDSQEFKMARP